MIIPSTWIAVVEGGNVSSKHLFCFGMGFSARALANRLSEHGWIVSGTSRDGSGRTMAFHSSRPLPDPARTLSSITHLLLSIPPDDDGDPVFNCHSDDLAGLRNVEWLGYLSTTGVYGDHGGGWVDEATPVAPTHRLGKRRVLAERIWLNWAEENKLPMHIFRLAGIYGPGRNALENVGRGTARRIVKPGHVSSRIHVDDIAAVIEASMYRPDPGTIYNVCDDEASPPQDVIAFAAELLDVEPPKEIPLEQAELSPLAASFYLDNKRVRNDRIKCELAVRLRYPDYRAGLRAVLK